MTSPVVFLQVPSTGGSQYWIGILSTVVSLLLTAALVYLYFRQTRIQDRQQTLLEAQAKPIIGRGPIDVEGGSVFMTLSNHGGGVATDIRLVTKVEFEGDGGVAPFETEVPLEKVVQQESATDEEAVEHLRVGSSLVPHTESAEFVGNPTLGVRVNGEERAVSFREGIEYLAENGVSDLRCTIYLAYSDAFGETKREAILGGGTPLHGGIVLSEIVEPVGGFPFHPQ